MVVQKIKKFRNNTFSSLKIRNYRLYFIGQGISFSGTWMQTVAQGWLVLQLTHSGTQLGSVVALQFVPMLFLGPWGGLIVDRHNKRTILYIAQVAFGLLALAIAVLVFTGAIQIWMLYVFALLFGFVRIFDNPARQTFVAELVDAAHMKNAVSLNATENNLARAVGPSVAGVLIASVGIASCFLFNALSFLATIVTLYMMRTQELYQAPTYIKKSGELRAGFRYVWGSPLIRNTLALMAVVGAFAFEFQVSLPLLAQDTFHGGAGAYAALMSAMGAGAVVGGLFAAGRRSIASRHLVIFAFLFGASMVAVALMPTLAWAVAGMLVVGFFSINVTSLGNTMLQLEAAPLMRGRVMALWGVAMIGSTPIGGPIVGFVGEYFGGRWGLGLGGAMTILAAALAALVLLKKGAPQKISTTIESRSEEAQARNIAL
ncbi:MAG: MFS transporter [bacterium]|nr:MFS transporter [bacterium]